MSIEDLTIAHLDEVNKVVEKYLAGTGRIGVQFGGSATRGGDFSDVFGDVGPVDGCECGAEWDSTRPCCRGETNLDCQSHSVEKDFTHERQPGPERRS